MYERHNYINYIISNYINYYIHQVNQQFNLQFELEVIYFRFICMTITRDCSIYLLIDSQI